MPCLSPFGLKTDFEKVTTRENNERWLNLFFSGQSCPAVKTNVKEEWGSGVGNELCKVKPYSQKKFWCQN